MSHAHAKPIGGKLLDPLMKVLLALFGLGALVMAYRFFVGLGPVSNMTDGYAWGIWEPVNVLVITGVGAGAYSLALLCYILNRGEYHPFVRPAVLMGALCYTVAGASVMIALGRYWNVYWLVLPSMWNLNSVLLEVAVCVISYVSVLWVEMVPALLEKAASSESTVWSRFGAKWGRRMSRAMPYLFGLAIILPTMHQSSLTGLMLAAGPKMHPLWHSALLPTLGLVSCLSMGFGAVVVLTTILRYTWHGTHDQELFAKMSKVNAWMIFLYAALRLGDIAIHGKLKYLAVPDWHLLLFLLELALFLVPAFMFLSPRVQRNRGRLFGAALLVIAGGAFYRVDAMLTSYDPGDGWEYMPSLGEMAVTIGMLAGAMAVFIMVSRLFPVVAVEPRQQAHVTPPRMRAAAGR